MKKIAFIVFLFISSVAMAQNKAYRDRADKAFDEKDYVTAAYYYDKALDNGTLSSQGTVPYFSIRHNKEEHEKEVGYISWQLAESYRLYQNMLQAENAYKQTIDDYELYYPLARYWYVVCLLSNNHVDEAIANIKIFIDKNKVNKANVELGNKELQNCLFAKFQLKQSNKITAIKLGGGLNGDGGDFALSVNNGKFWFNSSRSGNGKGSKHSNDIYFSTKDSNSVKTKVDFGAPAKPGMQYGSPSLTSSGDRMYLTIWYVERGNTVAAIYMSNMSGGHWSAPQKLTKFVNITGYNSMQPCVSADGRKLYFASNQPCGFGGMDIWESDLDGSGMPLNAQNLGYTINTAEDDEAPYYNDRDQKLVYSSKGFVGMGGFDLFESTFNDKAWTWAHNMGAPFNSIKDDIYYYPDDKDQYSAYISTDRASACCLNLFKITLPPPPPPIPTSIFAGLVIDCATGKPLPGVTVSLRDSTTKQNVNISTAANGKYNFTLTYKHIYTLRIEKAGYFAKVLPVPVVANVTKTDTLFNPVACAQAYQINKPILIPNILYDFDRWELKPESEKVLDGLITILNDNPKIKVELGSHTDSKGSEWTNNQLSQDRAQSCVNYIILKGIAPTRIIAKGYGKSVPIAPNTLPNGKDNPAGRKLNRRTEFTVLSN